MSTKVVDTLITRFQLDDSQYSAGASRVTAKTQGLVNVLGGVGGASGVASAALGGIAVAATAAAVAIGAVGVAGAAIASRSIQAAADVQALEMALAQYSDTAEEAAIQTQRLADVAKLPGLGYREVVKASVRLQAVGFDARLAERAILAFGNALAASGGGKAELDGVILALTQIASKGQISAEEINQIAERAPQVRQALKDAFGTASTEEIQKMGVSAQDAILRIIAQMEKLPKVAGGWRNSLDNIGDAFDRAFVAIGGVINAVVIPAVDQLGGLIESLVSGGYFQELTTNFITAAQVGFNVKGVLGSLANIGESAGFAQIGNVFKFIADADGLGDGVVRVVSMIAATVEHLPTVIGVAMRMVERQVTSVLMVINSAIEVANSVLAVMDFLDPSGSIGPNIKPIKIMPGSGALDQAVGSIGARAEEIYGQYNAPRPSLIDGDTSMGGFRNPESAKTESALVSPLEQVAEYTRQTARHTEQMVREYQAHVIGGGDYGRLGITPRELRSIRAGGGGDKLDQAFDLIRDAIDEGRRMMAGQLASGRK